MTDVPPEPMSPDSEPPAFHPSPELLGAVLAGLSAPEAANASWALKSSCWLSPSPAHLTFALCCHLRGSRPWGCRHQHQPLLTNQVPFLGGEPCWENGAPAVCSAAEPQRWGSLRDSTVWLTTETLCLLWKYSWGDHLDRGSLALAGAGVGWAPTCQHLSSDEALPLGPLTVKWAPCVTPSERGASTPCRSTIGIN